MLQVIQKIKQIYLIKTILIGSIFLKNVTLLQGFLYFTSNKKYEGIIRYKR